MSINRAISGWVWLSGTPIFSLSYSIKQTSPGLLLGPARGSEYRFSAMAENLVLIDTHEASNFASDITAYRPDPRNSIKNNIIYAATIIFEQEFDYKDDAVWVLREVIVSIPGVSGAKRFVNIR